MKAPGGNAYIKKVMPSTLKRWLRSRSGYGIRAMYKKEVSASCSFLSVPLGRLGDTPSSTVPRRSRGSGSRRKWNGPPQLPNPRLQRCGSSTIPLASPRCKLQRQVGQLPVAPAVQPPHWISLSTSDTSSDGFEHADIIYLIVCIWNKFRRHSHNRNERNKLHPYQNSPPHKLALSAGIG